MDLCGRLGYYDYYLHTFGEQTNILLYFIITSLLLVVGILGLHIYIIFQLPLTKVMDPSDVRDTQAGSSKMLEDTYDEFKTENTLEDVMTLSTKHGSTVITTKTQHESSITNQMGDLNRKVVELAQRQERLENVVQEILTLVKKIEQMMPMISTGMSSHLRTSNKMSPFDVPN